MWERWEEVTDPDSVLAGMSSYNHPMNGAFAVCFHKYLAGIKFDEQQPGFGNVLIKPCLPEKLKEAEASADTIRGIIAASWHKQADSIILHEKIPFNCKATVYVPLQSKEKGRVLLNGDRIYEDRYSWNTSHCRYLGTEPGYAVFSVDAGEFRFVSNEC